jgi:hypothetical protein
VAGYFVCVDACVLIDLFVEIIGKGGATPKWWEELKALVDAKEAKLLVPAVTLMEFRKWVRRKLQTVPKTGLKIQPPSAHEGFDGVINEQLSKELKPRTKNGSSKRQKTGKPMRKKCSTY